MTQKTYNWGIIATGNISQAFAKSLEYVPNANLLAVGSRVLENAKKFAASFNIPKYYGNYADVFNNLEVKIVYIGTPHSFHYQNVKDALHAGKHVLCEKAFTLNQKQAEEIIALARNKNLFLMEAMWNRFQPCIKKVKEILATVVLGEIYHMDGNFAINVNYDPLHRLFNPDLGGSALLDLGVYPIALASHLLGLPDNITSKSHLCATGVDDQVNILFDYHNGCSAQLFCASRFASESSAVIFGSKGRLKIHGPIPRPQKLSLYLDNKKEEIIECPYEGNAYHYQALAVMEMLDKAKIEHPLMPLDETLAIMKIMDSIRYKAGFYYPFEKV